MKKTIAAAVLMLAAGALAACGEREKRQEGGIEAVTPSDAMMSDAEPMSEAPAATDAASDAAAVIPPADTHDLSADDIAATGNTSRRTESAADAEPAQ